MDADIKLVEAPEILEDRVQAIVGDLKELNLATEEEYRPVYVSTMVKPKEEEKYFKVLTKFKDVFRRSYNKMPGLDPNVAVHKLSIKRGAPKSQFQ